MQESSNPRLYNIQNDPILFHTGRGENGNQMLIGVQFPEIVLVEFDAQGNYLRVVTREIPKQFLSVGNGIFQADDTVLLALIENWKDEMGLIPGTISVKQFFLPDRWIGIRDLPQYIQDYLDAPGNYDEELSRELQEEIRQWREHGDFVLNWDEDYDLNQEGEIIGS